VLLERCPNTIDLELGRTDSELLPFDERVQLSIFGAPAPVQIETRLILVGCVFGKNRSERELPAKELYKSTLWTKRRRYAESAGEQWGIVSALFGVISPEAPLPYYEKKISGSDLGLVKKIADGIVKLVGDGPAVLEIHAGAPYVKKIIEALESFGLDDRIRVETPVEKLQIGELLRWYNTTDEG
jgi:uncharacterized protein DUF6884